MDTLAFGYILPTTGRIPDLHRLENVRRRAHPQKSQADSSTRLGLFL